MTALQALKALRALRALRPLRVISKDEGMKLVVMSLMASVPSMSNVLLVCFLFILIFSIMGVNYFKEQLYHCVPKPGLSISELDKFDNILKLKVRTKQDCLNQGGVWENHNANFDNTFEAMSTLFQMMTTEGWV